MADTVKMELLFHRDDKGPGDTVEVDAVEARRLQRANLAIPATVGAAKKVGSDPETAATKKD